MIILIIGLLIIDLASKFLVSKCLVLGKSIVIIKSFLDITYVKNTGVAWSILSDNKILVLIISGLIIGLICMYIYKNKPKSKVERVCYALIVAGALGNFINRLIDGAVIDFIDVKIFSYDYPIFNLADVFIVIGVLALIIYTWRSGDYGNSSK